MHEATFEPALLAMATSKRHSTSAEALAAARSMQVRGPGHGASKEQGCIAQGRVAALPRWIAIPVRNTLR